MEKTSENGNVVDISVMFIHCEALIKYKSACSERKKILMSAPIPQIYWWAMAKKFLLACGRTFLEGGKAIVWLGLGLFPLSSLCLRSQMF